MLGKRPRQMKRTVSVCMMGTEPISPELPLEKHKPPIAPLPQPPLVHFHEPSPMELNGCGPRLWQKKEVGAVGLSIVAALHGSEAHTNPPTKDSSSSVVVMYKPVNQNILLPVANPFASNKQQQQQQRYGLMEPQAPRKGSGSYVKDLNSGIHFLEACCFCKKKLSQGRDIYMYRGDKAFCSEECRHQQILIDERKEKCSLTALKMRTAPQSAHSSGQHNRGMATSTAAG